MKRHRLEKRINFSGERAMMAERHIGCDKIFISLSGCFDWVAGWKFD
jgi:hypothetical protein